MPILRQETTLVSKVEAQPMVKDGDTGQNPQKSEREHKPPPRIRLWVISGAFIIFIFFSLIAYFHPSLPDRVKFATESILSTYVLLAVIAQAFIYDQQRKAMREQLEAMTQQGRTLRSQVRQGYKQVDLATKQTDAMQKQLGAMMYGQRAYITVSNLTLKSGEALGVAKFELHIENSGNTPANKVQIYSTGSVRACLPIPDIKPPEWFQLGIVAPRGRALYVIDLTKYMRRMTEAADSTIPECYHCQGVVIYRDIFGDSHTTKFCIEVSGRLYHTNPCKEGGNEAD